MKKATFAVLAAALLLTFVLQGSVFAATKTLTVWTWIEQMKDYTAAFEKANPGVKINLQVMPWDQLRDQLLTAMAAKSNVPDVIALSSSFAPAMMEAGAFAEVPFNAAERKRYDQVEWKTYDWNGKSYGVPYDVDLNVVFYRKDILAPYLKKLGLKEFPKTWDEYVKLGKEAKKDGNYLTFVQINSWRAYYYRYLVVNNGVVYDEKANRFAFNSKAGLEALDFMKNLLDDGIGVKWAANWADVMPALKSGKVLTFNMGPWYAGELRKQAPEMAGKWAMAPLPKAKPDYPGTVLNGTALAVTKGAKNSDAAWDYVRFLTNDENMVSYFEKVGSLPAVKTVWSNKQFTEPDAYFGNQKIYQVIREALDDASPFQLIPKQTEVESIFTQYVSLAQAGQMSAKEALDTAVAKANALIGAK